MFVSFRSGAFVAVLAALATPVLAQQKLGNESDYSSKEALHARMLVLEEQIRELRASNARPQVIAPYAAELGALSTMLGGDAPARVAREGAQPQIPMALVSAPGCGGAATTTTNYAGTTGPISDPVPNYVPPTFTAVVSGVGTYLWDVNLNTAISHTFPGDIDMTLTSPGGTTVTITTDNGVSNDNAFNGTLWDDSVNDGVVDHVYANNVVVPMLSPEGQLAAFRGEDPNGTWTLTIADDQGGDVGNLNSWSLDVSTLASAPVETTTTVSSTPGLAIPDNSTVMDSIVLSGLGTFLDKVVVYVELPHTESADLDVTLTSPLGTVIKLTTDNGTTLDNVFNGTTFDPNTLVPVTDRVYANNVVATPLSPEGGFDGFLGQDPNGTWTLTVTDDLATDVGSLARWDLSVTTTAPPAVSAPSNFAGTTGALPDIVTGVTPVASTFTTLVSGAGTYLWDVDVLTGITHTFNGDLDITITSPGGTVVTLTTDNGGLNDDVFNGTVWDDNVNDRVVDHVYANNVLASPLSPEGRLDAFRGEDPNGTWTLTVTDDAAADLGAVNSWSLDVTTTTAPAEVSTTVSQSPNLPIPDNNPAGVSDVIALSGLGTSVTEVEVYLEMPHTFPADADISLQSPAGTVVVLSTDNGGGSDNIFNGTLFDADVVDPVTDHVYANNVVVPLLAPEGSFANFKNEDPNGNWTLTIVDDAGALTGTFVRWDLTVRTCTPGPGTEYCGEGDPNRTTGCPCGNAGAPGNGCASSFNANGAHLTASGTVALDDVVLLGSGMNATGNCIFLKGDVSTDAGVVFGDGVRCTDGSLIRLRAKPLVGGTSSFPDSAETVTLSQRGGTPVGSGFFASYTVYYRNAAAAFCPPETFNAANGYRIVW